VGLSAIFVSASLFAPSAWAGPEPEPAPAVEIPEGRSRVGPVWMSDLGRARVRSMRPEGASIHVAHAARAEDPDRELRKALAEFERQTFPEESATQLRQTIVDEPPEPWMRELDLPDLPVRWNAKTIEYLRYFKDDARGRSLMRAWLTRMGRYEDDVRGIFDELGVPQDLMFVALVESGFRPGNTNSLTGAGGMWQFMEATGRVYGLQSDYWFDDRYDHVKATYAAAAYLKDLEVRFGSWEMALAAYNAGYGLVLTTIRRNNTNNYWALCEIEAGLPYQTTNYVPKLVAAAIVARNRAAFGLDDVSMLPPAQLVEVKVPASTRLEDLAKRLDLELDLLEEYNASLRRGRTPPKGGPIVVRLPKDSLAKFEQLGDQLRAPDQDFTTHAMLLGEDLEMIARQHGITVKHLRKLNAVHDSAEVRDGTVLVVPRVGTEEILPVPPPLAAVPPLTVPSGKRLVFLWTCRSTTPRRISSVLRVRWDDVVAWNDLDPHARVQDEMMLQLLVPADFDAAAAGARVFERDQVVHAERGTAAHLEAMLAERDLVRRGYQVRKGENLKNIARRFKTSMGSLARINGFRRSHKVEAGEVIVVYVEKGQTKGTRPAPDPRPTTLTEEIEALGDGEGIPGSRRRPSTAGTSRLPGGGPARDSSGATK
jgi:membrane-bound lytic murein transglycosylase D